MNPLSFVEDILDTINDLVDDGTIYFIIIGLIIIFVYILFKVL